MANSYFRFKKFTVHQDASAMKVTTDACLFGAIAATEWHTMENLRVLDIGAGTGLLSLMFAQKNARVYIDAVELDEAAASQAEENCRQSVFSNRISVYQTDILHYNPGLAYDLVISNPPFYSKELKGPDERKNKAHHDGGLTLPGLLQQLPRLLNPGGKFCLLLPPAQADIFRAMASGFDWFCYKKFSVKQTPSHDVFRVIMFFSKDKTGSSEEMLVIKEGTEYSEKFTSYLRDYYLYL